MARDPACRYASVAEMESDLGRHLDGLPVSAIPPSPPYLLKRFVLRHRRAAFTAAAAVAALALALGAWVLQLRSESRRFEEARKLVRTVLFDVQPALSELPATLPLRRKLIGASRQYLDAVSRDMGGNSGLLEELSGAYLELSVVEGNPLYSNLGDLAAARTSLERAEALLTRARAAEPDRPSLPVLATRLFIRLAEYHGEHGDAATAQRYAKQALIAAEQSLAADPSDPDRIWRAGVANYTAALTMPPVDWKARIAGFGRAAHLVVEAADRKPGDPRYRRSINAAHRRIAGIYAAQDQFGQAREHALLASGISAQLLAESPANPQTIMDAAADASVMGEILDYSGRDSESVAYYARAVELLGRAADPANARIQERLAVALRDYAEAFIETGMPAKAADPARRSLDLFESLAAGGRLAAARGPGHAYAWVVWGQAALAIGNRNNACTGFRTALRRFEEIDSRTPLALNWRTILAKARTLAATCPAQ